MDNTAATYGGLLTFKRVDNKPIFEPIAFTTPLHLVVIGTGITASTSQVVADVRRFKEENMVFFKHLLSRYNKISKSAVNAIRSGAL